MINDALKAVLIDAGKGAVKDALPASITTDNGFTIPLEPITDAILDLAVVGFEALLKELELKRVDVVGGEDTEVVVTIHD